MVIRASDDFEVVAAVATAVDSHIETVPCLTTGEVDADDDGFVTCGGRRRTFQPTPPTNSSTKLSGSKFFSNSFDEFGDDEAWQPLAGASAIRRAHFPEDEWDGTEWDDEYIPGRYAEWIEVSDDDNYKFDDLCPTWETMDCKHSYHSRKAVDVTPTAERTMNSLYYYAQARHNAIELANGCGKMLIGENDMNCAETDVLEEVPRRRQK